MLIGALFMRACLLRNAFFVCVSKYCIAFHLFLQNLKTPVIIDNGSGLCKCGFSNQDKPAAVFPALIGRPKYEVGSWLKVTYKYAMLGMYYCTYILLNDKN